MTHVLFKKNTLISFLSGKKAYKFKGNSKIFDMSLCLFFLNGTTTCSKCEDTEPL